MLVSISFFAGLKTRSPGLKVRGWQRERVLWKLARRCRGRLEYVIVQSSWLQSAQNIPGLGYVLGGSMGHHNKLTGLDRAFILDDAVLRDTQAEEPSADRAQPTHHHGTLKRGDDPSHERPANQHRAYARNPKKCGAKQQAPQATPERT